MFVRRSNSGVGEIFPNTSRPAFQLHLASWVTVSFLWGKAAGHAVDHPHHLAPRLKKEQSYNSRHSLGIHGLFQGKILHLTFSQVCLVWETINQLQLSRVTQMFRVGSLILLPQNRANPVSEISYCVLIFILNTGRLKIPKSLKFSDGIHYHQVLQKLLFVSK